MKKDCGLLIRGVFLISVSVGMRLRFFCDEANWFVDSLDSWRKNTGIPKKVSEAIKDAVNSVSDMKIK